MPRFAAKSRGFVALGVALGAGAVGGAGCAKPATENTVLQASDLQIAAGGSKFDPNEIVDSASFSDTLGLDPDQVQNFLAHTPYKRSSFLETYQSNGIRAVDAIMNASTTYRLNPLVFLVRLEVAQGLVGEQFYPFPPARVEYAFGCGCMNNGVCDPALAGLDKQINCLGRALRTSLDEIKANNTTAGGWGPGVGMRALDGVAVTPADDSTAALYQYDPIVGAGKTGNWLVWNIWQNYATALDYQPPIDSGSSSAWVGDSCSADAVCDYSGGNCLLTDLTPGGMCSFDCSNAECPSDPQRAPTFCASFDAGGGQRRGACLVVCNPSSPQCRPGYTCVPNVPKYGAPNVTESVCYN